jgi:uncharacterized membrane protein (UPF0136 family)
MTATAIVALLYGLILVLGGVIGYVKARSVASLASGIVLGGASLVGAAMTLSGAPLGRTVALVATGAAVLVFAAMTYGRLSSGRSATRSLVFLVLGVAVAAVLVVCGGPAAGHPPAPPGVAR